MADALLTYLRQSLPTELASLTEPYIARLQDGEYGTLLQDPDARALFGHVKDAEGANLQLQDFASWNDFIFHRLGTLLADRTRPEKQSIFFCIGYAALLAFVQSNVTGPPPSFESANVLLPEDVSRSSERTTEARKALLESLGMDGIAAYRLTPNIELLCLADAVFTCPPILKYVKPARWAKLRVEFLHQRLLSEVSSTLQEVIYDDLELLEDTIFGSGDTLGITEETRVEFLLERATIHIHHGLDKFARADLDEAKKERHFEFALTGLMGKRTKFQQTDVSQLAVLARSNANDKSLNGTRSESKSVDVDAGVGLSEHQTSNKQPANLDLNDDTLLETIAFTEKPNDSTQPPDEETMPPSLSTLDPSNQPQLEPIDSTILLALASSITNTSPQDGLTREETLPYATRVLEGGSSNWQIYTQALLLRSRIEGYKARTIERGLLQLQALVDQVISDTIGTSNSAEEGINGGKSSTFLPAAKEHEAAPAQDRLRYVFQLASPSRWDLEAELAARWIQLGGLRSALDIYERLEMWAETALCWAGTEREDKARKLLRRQLFHATAVASDTPGSTDDESETWSGAPRDPPPADAPRLYCILGDIDQSPEMYEKAWEVSNQRYARAQRSLGRFYFAAQDHAKAAEAYSKSLKANQLNHSSWFALGCALLELAQFDKAAEAFSRCVQMDDSDAEAWSNLAAALLRKEPDQNAPAVVGKPGFDEEPADAADSNRQDAMSSLQRNRQDALKALKTAASLKRDSYRIWENVLIVSASLTPPDFTSILAAQKQIITLRGSTDGEKCIDFDMLALLVEHLISLSDKHDTTQPGLARMTVKFVDEDVVPLITSSADLWQLISKLALWRNKPSSALDAEEKAWRAITSQPGWETENEKRWDEVVEATVRLCDSYESLGPKERTEGMGAGEPVAKDWRFKARSAVRGILGRGKGSWDGTSGWDRLKNVMDDLKS